MKLAGQWILGIGIVLFLAVVGLQAASLIHVASVIVPATWFLIVVGGALVLVGRRRERRAAPVDEP
jgi:hypothetical protein